MDLTFFASSSNFFGSFGPPPSPIRKKHDDIKWKYTALIKIHRELHVSKVHNSLVHWPMTMPERIIISTTTALKGEEFISGL